jgi:ABC-type multidrug transport system fused ATPase/permease subunit
MANGIDATSRLLLKTETSRLSKYIIKIGFLLLLAAMPISFFLHEYNIFPDSKLIAALLWTIVLFHGIISSIITIKLYSNAIRNNDVNREFILIKGFINSLEIILYIWLILTLINNMPSIVNNELYSYKLTVESKSKSTSYQFFQTANAELAYKNAKEFILKYDFHQISNDISNLITSAKWHVARIVILLWFFSLGPPFVSINFKRPYLTLFVGVCIAAIFSVGFDIYNGFVLGEENVDYIGKFIVALGACTFGFYSSVFLEPINKFRVRPAKIKLHQDKE